VADCRRQVVKCPIRDILSFHQKLMPSEKALQHALKKLLQVPFKTIAPQHGSVITDKKLARKVFELLADLKAVGIDALEQDGYRISPERIQRHFE
jgi:flavorubredoxin